MAATFGISEITRLSELSMYMAKYGEYADYLKNHHICDGFDFVGIRGYYNGVINIRY